MGSPVSPSPSPKSPQISEGNSIEKGVQNVQGRLEVLDGGMIA